MATHIYWFVSGTRTRTVKHRIGRGRVKRVIEDEVTEPVPPRAFWVADDAYRYCRENGLPIRNAKMSFQQTMSLTS